MNDEMLIKPFFLTDDEETDEPVELGDDEAEEMDEEDEMPESEA